MDREIGREREREREERERERGERERRERERDGKSKYGRKNKLRWVMWWFDVWFKENRSSLDREMGRESERDGKSE